MTPYQQAVQLYEERGYDEADYLKDLQWHVSNGYVYSSPLGIALARPVSSTWCQSKVSNLSELALSDIELTAYLDTWHIHLAVGDMQELLSHLPYALPFISFERLSGFKRYKLNRLIR